MSVKPELATVFTNRVERLDELEAVIKRGLYTFAEVGTALTEIRADRLYHCRDGYASFEQYCQERWGFNRQRAAQLIGAAEMSTIVDSPIPNEAVARELTPLKKEPAKMRAAWSTATATTLTPTAREVRAVVAEIIGGSASSYEPCVQHRDALIAKRRKNELKES